MVICYALLFSSSLVSANRYGHFILEVREADPGNADIFFCIDLHCILLNKRIISRTYGTFLSSDIFSTNI
jgi:hypothetical protein